MISPSSLSGSASRRRPWLRLLLSGRETEKIAGLFNRVTYFPQLVIEGFLLFLQLFTIALLLGLVGIKDSVLAHPYIYLVATIVIYLIWLLVTICDLVEDEVVSDRTYTVSEDHGGEVAHRILTKQDYVAWSAGTFFLWMAVLAMTGAWLFSRILV